MTHPPRSTRTHQAAVTLALTGVLTLLLLAYAWPASELAPRHLPVAVAGPPDASRQVSATLERALGPGALDVVTVGSRDAAVTAVESRDAYGAVVLSPAGPEMLVASAAGPVVAQSLTQVGTQLAERSGTPPHVTDVVPLPPGDPHGAVFAAGAFPLVIGGIVVGAAVALGLRRRRERIVVTIAASLASGLALAAVQQLWFGALAGSYWANAVVYALAVAALAAMVAGLHHVLGRVGLGLAVATVLVLGNPLSGITSAPELLPTGWSTLGQLLPPGAAGSALRSTAFFDGAGATAPLLVLAGWLLVGLALLARPTPRPATETRHEAARQSRPHGPTPVDAPHPL